MDATATALPSPAKLPNSDSAAVKNSHEQVERITYLASLVSRFEDVDTMMDSLRGVTATWDQTTPLGSQDIAKLQDLERDLKSYLINKDAVRAFTAESLDRQLKEHAQGGNVLWRRYVSLVWVLGSSLLAAGIPYILPAGLLSEEGRTLLAIPLFFVALHVGIGWLYLSALKNFRQEVRKAFQTICIGVILFGLTFSHYAVIAALQLDKYPAFQDAGITWFVAIPYMFIFWGLCQYARQVGVTSRLLSARFVAVIVAIVVVIAIAEAYLPPNSNVLEDYLDAFLNVGGRLLDPFAIMGAILAWKIRKKVAASYSRPMLWLFVYLFIAFAASVLTTILFLLGSFGSASGGTATDSMPFYLFMALAGIPSQLLLLWTGYSFKKESSK